jgi:uncharacterized membrane protein YfcA
VEIVGYILALLIGVSLGLIGGGGSILAVPVLAYLFNLDEKIATAYSLFIVGTAALVGGARQSKNGYVDWRTAVVFGFPAILGVWIIRHYVVPVLPDVLFTLGHYDITRRMGMLGLFSLLMIVAAYTMLNDNKKESGTGKVNYNYSLILLEGLTVGALTGFVGAGGGFLIIPALVILANLDIKTAIGTSLIIIALKSLLGFFVGDALLMDVDWEFLCVFTSLAIAGIFLGIYINQYIDGRKLKKGFGYFILVIAVFIFALEFVFKKL